jgi:hypothetical protein
MDWATSQERDDDIGFGDRTRVFDPNFVHLVDVRTRYRWKLIVHVLSKFVLPKCVSVTNPLICSSAGPARN